MAAPENPASVSAADQSPRAGSRRPAHHLLSGSNAWEQSARLDVDPVAFTTFSDAAELAAKRGTMASQV